MLSDFVHSFKTTVHSSSGGCFPKLFLTFKNMFAWLISVMHRSSCPVSDKVIFGRQLSFMLFVQLLLCLSLQINFFSLTFTGC